MSRPKHTPAMFVREPSAAPKGDIVFVHDAWHGAWCWDEYFTKDFSDKGFRCITFNLPGHTDQSEHEAMNKFGFDDYVDALASVVAHCQESPVIIGHGMGALVLQKYLQTHTCRMAVFMSPMPSNGYWKGLLRLLINVGTWKALHTKNLYEVVRKTSAARSLFFTRQAEPAKVKTWHGRLCGASYLAFRELPKLDIKPISPSLTPSLVIGGGKDRLIPVREFQRTSRIHDAGLIIIPHMGHDMMLDHGHAWLADLLINCMDYPVEKETIPVVNRLKIATSTHRRSLEPVIN